jgi:superfamily I DNA/RNA helicase
MSINQIVNDSKRLWNEISSENSSYPINHDCYLKIWQLSDPRINTPVIFIDESQDLDPVMLSVLLRQKAQKIWVGDRYQQIYEWRGAINAMDKVSGCHEYSLTETYRFPLEISSIANCILSKLGEHLKITSHKPKSVKKPEKTAYIARYNSSLIDMAYALAEENKTFCLQKFFPEKIEKHCRSIIELYHGIKPFMDLYSVFSSVEELEAFLEEEYNDEMNRALSFCKSSSFDINKIRLKLNAIAYYNTESANIILITAHQSKGLEWDQVVIANDFENKLSSPNCATSEFNLIYVAVTRAKNILKGVQSLPSLMSLLSNDKSQKLFNLQNIVLTEVQESTNVSNYY